MSHRACTLVWDHFDGGGNELLVMLAIADCLNTETGRCDPSYQHLADRTRLNRATVIRIVQRLREAGHLTISVRSRDDGARRSNQFELAPRYTEASQAGALFAPAAPVPDATPQSQAATTGSPGATTGESHHATGGVAPGATPPVATVRPHEPEVEPEDEPEWEVIEGEWGASDGATATPVADPEPPPPRKTRRTRKPSPLGPGALIYRSECRLTPNIVQREGLDRIVEVCGEENLRLVCRQWMAHGYNPRNVKDIVDVVLHGWRSKAHESGLPRGGTRRPDGTLDVSYDRPSGGKLPRGGRRMPDGTLVYDYGNYGGG